MYSLIVASNFVIVICMLIIWCNISVVRNKMDENKKANYIALGAFLIALLSLGISGWVAYNQIYADEISAQKIKDNTNGEVYIFIRENWTTGQKEEFVIMVLNNTLDGGGFGTILFGTQSQCF